MLREIEVKISPFVEDELLLAVLALGLEVQFPGLGRAVGRQRGADLVLVFGFLAFEVATRADAEDPEVPRIGHGRGRCGSLRRVEGHLQARRKRRFRGIPNQPETEHSREPDAPLILGIGLHRHVRQRLIDSREPSEADELDGVLQAPATGRLSGDEHVHIGVRAVANVVDERDFRAQVVLVALRAIEKYSKRAGAVGCRCILGCRWCRAKNDQAQQEHEREVDG